MLNMEFKHIEIPKEGKKIHFDTSGNLVIPDNPIIPFIEGDGIGSDITPAMIEVVNNAVLKAYDGNKKICLLYTSPSPRDGLLSRMPSSA